MSQSICASALARTDSRGAHFREEFQDEGECQRDDAHFAHAAAWEYAGPDRPPTRNVEPLVYEEVHMTQRSYK